MKLFSVEGTFHDGKVDLTDVPAGMERAKVIVTFLAPQPSPSPEEPNTRTMTLGMFAGPSMSTEEDFKSAEWQGEREFWEDEDGDKARH